MSSATPNFNVGGLASGLDTNTIVSQLLSIERQPKVRMQQRQQVEEARQNALKDVKTRLSNLLDSLASLKDTATWGDTQTVESSDTGKVTVTRTGGAAAGGYAIGVSQLARAHQLTQSTGLAAAGATDTLHIKVGAGSTINVAIASGDSLDSIAAKINGTTDMGVYASVVNSKLVLSGKTTGAANTIAVTSDATLAGDLGFAQSLAALDAQYTVNSGPVQTSSSNTVTAAIPGVTITLKGQTASDISVVVGAPAPDTSKVQGAIQSFVDQYNSTIDFVRGKLAEQKVKNPQTADDRAKGVLRGDVGLSGLLAQLRATVGEAVSGRPASVDTLAEIGVSTGAASSTISHDAVAGKLSLNVTKLKDKLNTNFSDVKALFTNATGSYPTEGLTQRLEGYLKPWTKSSGILDGRIDSEQSMIDSLLRQQADQDVRLTEREKQLRAQFTAMETALSQSQAQGQWLNGQITALNR